MKYALFIIRKYKRFAVFVIIILVVSFSKSKTESINAKRKWSTIAFIDHFALSKKSICYDFGKISYGTIKLRVATAKVDTLHLTFSETVPTNEKHTSDFTISRKLVVYPNKENYTLDVNNFEKPYSSQSILLPKSFASKIIPFRYCLVKNEFSRTINIEKYSIESASDYDSSLFQSSDTTLNKIYEVCKNTIKTMSVFGVFVDGNRERIPYEGDAFITQRSHFSICADPIISKKTLEHLIQYPTWPTDWILHTVPLFYDYYMYTGDKEFLRLNYNTLKRRSLHSLAGNDGLISSKSKEVSLTYLKSIGYEITLKDQLKFCTGYNPPELLKDIVDWPVNQTDGFEFRPINSVTNAHFYNSIKLLSFLAEELGYNVDAMKFASLAEKCKKSYNIAFFDEESALYKDGINTEHISLHANLFALTFDLIPESRKSKVISFIKSKGMSCSPYVAQYLLDGLFDNNENQYAYSLIVARTKNSWYSMIANGYTTTLESWNFSIKPNADLTHSWSTAPLNLIQRQLWGIQPIAAGYKKIIINPKLLGLVKSSEIIIPTILGEILAKYKGTDKKGTYEFDIPPSMDVVLVVSNSLKVIINNVSIDNKIPHFTTTSNNNIFVVRSLL